MAVGAEMIFIFYFNATSFLYCPKMNCLNCLLFAELLSSECLRKVLYVLLHVGNYLNHGAAIGNAVGFRINSLWKINELRATNPGPGGSGSNAGKNAKTLLHFIAQVFMFFSGEKQLNKF